MSGAGAGHSPPLSTDVCVLGGGIAGLTVRAGLRGRDVVCLEAAERPGGLLRMIDRGEFSFDTTVHVLFFRRARTRRLVESLVADGLHRFLKHNLVWQGGRQIDYPYQYHLGQLPEAVRRECLDTLPPTGASTLHGGDPSFEAWLRTRFGDGLYRRFFGPYNQKLYGVSPSALVAAPMVWTIPSDGAEIVRRGAEPGAPPVRPWVECSYPRGRAGIEALPDALASRGEGPVLCGERVVSVDSAARVVTTQSGLRVRYQTLVSTLPLPALVACTDAPGFVRDAAASLSAAPVTVVHVGSHHDGEGLRAHWTYFPDREVPFYRMTRLETISPDVCPAGSAALLLECPGHEPPPRANIVRWLMRVGAITSPDVAELGHVVIPHAYVLFRHGWERALATVRGWLDAAGIRTAGRYGDWRYANIEETIESAIATAARVARAPEEEILDGIARTRRPSAAADPPRARRAGAAPTVGVPL